MDQVTLIILILGAGSILLAAWSCLPGFQDGFPGGPDVTSDRDDFLGTNSSWFDSIEDDLL